MNVYKFNVQNKKLRSTKKLHFSNKKTTEGHRRAKGVTEGTGQAT